MDKRWQLIADPYRPCGGGVILSGSGTPSVNGTYCPDGIDPVWSGAMWTKVGGTRYEDSIYLDPDTGNLFVTSGGLAADDIANVKFTGTAGFPPTFIPVEVGEPFGGTNPQPTAVMIPASPDFFIDVHPLNPSKFTEEEDLSFGLIAKRRKLATDLVFVGADFDYFRAIERDATRRCEEIFIRRQWKCGGVWKTIWTGSFSTGSGSWDFDNCQFTVKPEVVDRYTCLIKNLQRKFNALQVGPVDAAAVIIPSLEIAICTTVGFTPDPLDGCDQFGDITTSSWIDGWTPATTSIVGPGPSQINFFWRERRQTFCVNGNPVPPPGSGWTLFQDNCGVDGTAVYVRPTTISWTFGAPQAGTMLDGQPLPPDSSCVWTFVGIGGVDDPFAAGDDRLPYYVCLSAGDATELNRSRLLMDVLRYGLQQAGCPVADVVSDFFEENPVGDSPGYVSGKNYVTSEDNEVSALLLLQNSDAADPDATNPATLGEMTLKDLLMMLVQSFQVLWDIDADGNLRIEHWSYWNYPVGLVLQDYEKRVEPLAYRHSNNEVPPQERLSFQQAQGRDFVGVDIEYSGPCVLQDSEAKEYSVPGFTSDLAFMITDPTEVTKTGFTVLASQFDGIRYNVLLRHGALSGDLLTNGPLSVANLQDAFWRHNRYLPTGRMNKVDETFLGILPNTEQSGVGLSLCCDAAGVDSSKRVKTVLGTTRLGGIDAFLRRMEIDEGSEWVSLTLRYAY